VLAVQRMHTGYALGTRHCAFSSSCQVARRDTGAQSFWYALKGSFASFFVCFFISTGAQVRPCRWAFYSLRKRVFEKLFKR
jgi:hypothetical protein